MKTRNSLVWFKNDLRLHDNEMLCRAIAESDRILMFYCIDERNFRDLKLGFKKMGQNRYRFLLQCLEDLDKNLRSIGGSLVVTYGKPEMTIPNIIAKYNLSTVYTEEEYAIEELWLMNGLERNLDTSCKLVKIWGHTLYHKEDIPYAIEDIPMTSKAYRINTTKFAKVREPFLKPESYNALPHFEDNNLPSYEELGFHPEFDGTSELFEPGGETAGLKRLAYYTFNSQLLTGYRWTRNKSMGLDYSSKFSPYLALGCLSPRTIYATVKEYEEIIKKNQSTWWLVFEMVWRDFFTFKGMKMGSKIYKTEGFSNKEIEFKSDMTSFKRWCEGRTGIPFVDAHMRQLNRTGFMSNRGRVNCSSFLIHDYKIDWTWGASYFENKLLDYDSHVNWMNWHYQAYEIWYTNPVHQSLKYDAAAFIKKWIPELAELKTNLIHIPWLVDDVELIYPKPLEILKKWSRAINKIADLEK